MSGEWIGILAGLLVTCSFVPQVIYIFRHKSAKDISLFFNLLLFAGILLWLIYGIYFKLAQIIIWNAVGVVFTGALLYGKLKYGR